MNALQETTLGPLQAWGGEVVVIGDAHQPANIEQAFAAGLNASV